LSLIGNSLVFWCANWNVPGWTAPLWAENQQFTNPKRKRGNCRNVFPRLRFGLLLDAKVALCN